MALEWLRALEKGGSDGQHHHEHTSLTPEQIAIYITASVLLTLMAGLMSGLTLGLLSLDALDMEVLARSGTPAEKRYAGAIKPLVERQHFVLVTLLLCNAGAMEALPLFLDRLADPVTAIAISVSAVLVFGEILPQAVCSRCVFCFVFEFVCLRRRQT